MSDTQHDPEILDIPDAVAEPKSRHSLQLVWLIPIVAAIIGGTLAVRTYLQKGPEITITFKTGEGLEAGKTKIKYKDVEVGVVKEITVAKNLENVIVTAEMKKETKPYLVKDTRFWVVRPRISGGNVSGLETLMGGSFIGIDVGKSSQSQAGFSKVWSRRRLSPRMNRGASFYCTAQTSDRLTSVRHSIFAASRSDRLPPTNSTRVAPG